MDAMPISNEDIVSGIVDPALWLVDDDESLVSDVKSVDLDPPITPLISRYALLASLATDIRPIDSALDPTLSAVGSCTWEDVLAEELSRVLGLGSVSHSILLLHWMNWISAKA